MKLAYERRLFLLVLLGLVLTLVRLILLLLFFHLLEDPLEIVLCVGVRWIDAQRLAIGFDTLLQHLLPVQGVPEIVPRFRLNRRISRGERTLVRVRRLLELGRLVEGVAFVESGDR